MDTLFVNENKICVRLHDLVLELCKRMKGEEHKAWYIGLVNAYGLVLEEEKVMGIGSEALWKM